MAQIYVAETFRLPIGWAFNFHSKLTAVQTGFSHYFKFSLATTLLGRHCSLWSHFVFADGGQTKIITSLRDGICKLQRDKYIRDMTTTALRHCWIVVDDDDDQDELFRRQPTNERANAKIYVVHLGNRCAEQYNVYNDSSFSFLLFFLLVWCFSAGVSFGWIAVINICFLFVLLLRLIKGGFMSCFKRLEADFKLLFFPPVWR